MVCLGLPISFGVKASSFTILIIAGLLTAPKGEGRAKRIPYSDERNFKADSVGLEVLLFATRES